MRKKTVTKTDPPGKFGTIAGVFTPDVLTILGVIMYLRLGWMVGNAGFAGAVAIILLAKTVTICTGLSMASLTTNIKIGAGGAYSIVSKSLGLEAGGSIGIPLYIAQTLSAALYIIGFTEGWLRIFPGHSPQFVSTLVCIIILVISYISTMFAIRIQFIIMGIIALSLISIAFMPAASDADFILVGEFQDAGFWEIFAIFFPAVTGIMAGANMSGDLKDPRISIPAGTLSAIGVTFVVYVALAYILTQRISLEELRGNQMAMADHALWSPLVISGILAATFSSALGSMVGAPRILQALSAEKSVPFNDIFSKKTVKNEPRNATIFTAVIIEIAIITGNLDTLASLLTMFFLITYGTLNSIVFAQQSMHMISFRPTFKIPRFVSLLGAISCVGIMFLIDFFFSVIAVVVVIILYIYLARKGLESEWGDIRGGMLLVTAEKISRLAAKFPRHQISWKPDLLIPIDNPKVWGASLLLIRDITYPSGSIFAFTIKKHDLEETEKELKELLLPFDEQKIISASAVIEGETFLRGAKLVIQTLRSGTLRPNTLFLTFGGDEGHDSEIRQLVEISAKYGMGAILVRQHPRMAFGFQQKVNLWLRDKSPNWNLAMLIALRLQLNWEGKLNLITVASEEKGKKRMHRFLEYLNDQARLPFMTEFHVLIGEFNECLKTAPRADVNIFGMSNVVELDIMRDVAENAHTSCLFVADSGGENAFA